MTISKKCVICGIDFMDNDRVALSIRETFVFKPAHILDPEVFDEKGVRINLAAVKDPDALRELRKDYLKTEVGTQFVTWGKAEPPEGAFNFRHAECSVVRTGSVAGTHPAMKHAIRYGRAMRKVA
jgi:hypothetical protein